MAQFKSFTISSLRCKLSPTLRSSGQGAIMCKSRSTNRAQCTIWYEGTAQLLSLTDIYFSFILLADTSNQLLYLPRLRLAGSPTGHLCASRTCWELHRQLQRRQSVLQCPLFARYLHDPRWLVGLENNSRHAIQLSCFN